MSTSNPTPLPKRVKDESGNAYGKLTVMAFNGVRGRNARWLCRCECGNTAIVAGTDLRRKSTASCGCLSARAGRATVCGKSPEYTSWQEMKARCYNPKKLLYHRYGGRGITVCKRWLDSFVHFLEDMGPKPFPEATNERIDNDGNYEPGNCKWATRMEQSHNSSRVRLLTYNDETMCIAEWSRRLGIHPATLSYRLNHGWPLEKALTTPPIYKHSSRR